MDDNTGQRIDAIEQIALELGETAVAAIQVLLLYGDDTKHDRPAPEWAGPWRARIYDTCNALRADLGLPARQYDADATASTTGAA